MPQNALSANVSNLGGVQTVLNITAATVVKAKPGKVFKINVLVAGSAAGTVNDTTTVGAVATANEVAVIPNSVGPVDLEWPCANGIVITPGTGQTVAVSYQ